MAASMRSSTMPVGLVANSLESFREKRKVGDIAVNSVKKLW